MTGWWDGGMRKGREKSKTVRWLYVYIHAHAIQAGVAVQWWCVVGQGWFICVQKIREHTLVYIYICVDHDGLPLWHGRTHAHTSADSRFSLTRTQNLTAIFLMDSSCRGIGGEAAAGIIRTANNTCSFNPRLLFTAFIAVIWKKVYIAAAIRCIHIPDCSAEDSDVAEGGWVSYPPLIFFLTDLMWFCLYVTSCSGTSDNVDFRSRLEKTTK